MPELRPPADGPLRRELELFFTALGFFTRIPVPGWVPWSTERLNHSARYFALVGWVVGLAGALAFLLAAWLLPASVAVLLAMAVTIRLTGAFHEDGWADTCDGFGGGWEKLQVLTIMKDSRIGTYGSVGLLLMLGTKAVALTELARHGLAAPAIALLVAHPLSRFASTSLIHLLPYVREDETSKSKPLARRLETRELQIAAACGLTPLLLLELWQIPVLLLAVLLVSAWAARTFMRRLGGYTGDCLGAAQQATELTCYLVLLATWNSI